MITIPLARPTDADTLHAAIDRLCYRAGAHVAADGTVSFPAKREDCGDERVMRDVALDPDLIKRREIPMTKKPLMTPGQAAHAASFGPPLSGEMPSGVWEMNFNDDARDRWERIARHAIRQFNVGALPTPGEVVFESTEKGEPKQRWVELPASYRDHYERIAQAAIDTVRNQ